MDFPEEMSLWATRQQECISKAVSSNHNKPHELREWARRQRKKAKSSLSHGYAATINFIESSKEPFIREKDESRDAASTGSTTRSSLNDNREGYGEYLFTATTDFVTRHIIPGEYAILSLGIASLREGLVNSKGLYSPYEDADDVSTEFVSMAQENLMKVTESDFCTTMPGDNFLWFVKSYEGWLYFIKATEKYPKFLAVEILDALSSIILFGLHRDRKKIGELNEYCEAVYSEYCYLSSNGSTASRMLGQVDEIKDKINSNINKGTENKNEGFTDFILQYDVNKLGEIIGVL